MKRLDDFICENSKCTNKDVVEERFHYGMEVYCSYCYSPMKKLRSSKQKFDLKGEGFYNNKNLQ